VASGSFDNTVKLWDSAVGALQQTLEGHSDAVYAVAFSPDGKLVASGSYDNTVKLWDSATGALQQTLEGHSSLVYAVAFSPDGKLVASGSHDKTVKLWDSTTGALHQTLEVDVAITRLSFSRYGLYLETDRGLLRIRSTYTVFRQQPQPECNIFVKERWVTRGMENLLWLPPEYRAVCSAVQSGLLVLGHESGRITFIEFTLSS
jgi:WD40 repeat protein